MYRFKGMGDDSGFDWSSLESSIGFTSGDSSVATDANPITACNGDLACIQAVLTGRTVQQINTPITNDAALQDLLNSTLATNNATVVPGIDCSIPANFARCGYNASQIAAALANKGATGASAASLFSGLGNFLGQPLGVAGIQIPLGAVLGVGGLALLLASRKKGRR